MIRRGRPSLRRASRRIIFDGAIFFGGLMALKQGEIYSCPDPDCGCEISVTKGAKKNSGVHIHLCCCGREMSMKK
jgi:hypothetical protein